jgi:hypothetical protein
LAEEADILKLSEEVALGGQFENFEKAIEGFDFEAFEAAVVVEEEPPLFTAPRGGLIGRGNDGQNGGGVFDAVFQFSGPLGSGPEVGGILPDGDRPALSFVKFLAKGFLEGLHPLGFRV